MNRFTTYNTEETDENVAILNEIWRENCSHLDYHEELGLADAVSNYLWDDWCAHEDTPAGRAAVESSLVAHLEVHGLLPSGAAE